MKKPLLLLACLIASPAYAELTQEPGQPIHGMPPFQIFYPPDNPPGCSIGAGFRAMARYRPSTTGSCNIGIGQAAVGGKKANSAFTGTNNIGLGYLPLQTLTTGSNNIAIGSGGNTASTGPGSSISSGSRNILIGAEVGFNYDLSAASNDNIVFEGEGAGVSGNQGSGNVLFDTHGGWPGSNTVFLGADDAYQGQFTCQRFTLEGYSAGRLNACNGAAENDVIIFGNGATAGAGTNDVATATSNTVIEFGGSDNIVSATHGSHAGTHDTIVGINALHTNAQDDARQTCMGFDCLFTSNVAAAQNTAFGYQTGKPITTGKNNTLFGYNVASATLTTGSSNIIIGANITTLAAGTASELNIGGLLFGHLAGTSAPTLSACGASPTIDTHANNASGTVTAGSGALASCTVTFASAYTTWNHCKVTSQAGNVAGFAYTYTISALTITGTSITSDTFDYDCDGV